MELSAFIFLYPRTQFPCSLQVAWFDQNQTLISESDNRNRIKQHVEIDNNRGLYFYSAMLELSVSY